MVAGGGTPRVSLEKMFDNITQEFLIISGDARVKWNLINSVTELQPQPSSTGAVAAGAVVQSSVTRNAALRNEIREIS